MSFEVLDPGVLTLIQDRGRFGEHGIGLTTGGPLDPEAFDLCNRLLQNPVNSTLLEVSFGGLKVKAQADTFICVTGAKMPLHINDEERSLWQVHKLLAGDIVTLGFSEAGCRGYLGVAEGLNIPPTFGSSATVIREKIGGLRGEKSQLGDILAYSKTTERSLLKLPTAWQPKYPDSIDVRVVLGYQHNHFSSLQIQRFFGSTYKVSNSSDRMGYRLEGPAIECDIQGILSEGICHGAIQVPADGQPIVLLNDRQTIGGYPKIGSAFSLDTAKLSQLTPGAVVKFSPMSVHSAHNTLHLSRSYLQRMEIVLA